MAHRTPDPGSSFGTAGGSLVDVGWAASPQVAAIGRDAELRTARLLEEDRPHRTAVLHDLRIPARGYTANIDHAVVSGDRVLLIDTKAWRPGRYWTVFGVTRRGWRRFAHADTRTPAMARDRIARMLTDQGLPAQVITPLVAVWPSAASGAVHLRWLRMNGCTPVRADRLPRRVRRLVRNQPANPHILRALAALVGGTGAASRR